MKEVFEKIMAKVQHMSDAEFSAELARYKDDDVVAALSQMEMVLSDHAKIEWLARAFSVVWSLATSSSVQQPPLPVSDFEDADLKACNASNDERFALAA